MLTTAQGTYHDGIVELDEQPAGIAAGRVVVTFIDDSVHTKGTNAAGRIVALSAWLSSLPPVPSLPLEALDREQLYR